MFYRKTEPSFYASLAATVIAGAAQLSVWILVSVISTASVTAHEGTRAAALARLEPEAGADRRDDSRSLSSVTLTFRDAASDEEFPANVRISYTDSGKPWVPSDPRTAPGLYRTPEWYTLESGQTLHLKPGKIRVEAFRGVEWSHESIELDLGLTSQSAEIRLRRLFDARDEGWVSGNTHLHLQQTDRAYADRYLTTVPWADEVLVNLVSYLERDGDDVRYITNEYTPEDLAALEHRDRALNYGWGQELRHNFGEFGEGYGHALLLNIDDLVEPVSIGPSLRGEGASDAPALQVAIDRARAAGATVIWAHNDFGMEDQANWVSGRVHAQNTFDGGDITHYDRSFYRYLDVGLSVPFSTGTDWFMFDLLRVYVMEPAQLSIGGWLSNLQRGKSFITNGPLMEITVDGVGPGGRIDTTSARPLHVRAHARGRDDFKALQVIYNGRVVRHGPTSADVTDGVYRASLDFMLEADEPGWIALRIPWENNANALGHTLRAHTSPVYIDANGQRRFDRNTALGLIDEMTESKARITASGVFARDTDRDTVLSVYDRAISALRSRIAQTRREPEDQ